MADTASNVEQVNTRMSRDIVRRLRAHVKRLKTARPGSRVTLADAHRDIVVRGLDIAERETT